MVTVLGSPTQSRSFGNLAVERTTHILDYLFTSREAAKTYDCVRLMKAKGDETVGQFRHHITETVASIVEQKNPLLAMRASLLSNIHHGSVARLLSAGEFHEHRQDLYDALNRTSDVHWDDDRAAMFRCWSDMENLCLRMLQTDMFEQTSRDDWWNIYTKCVEGLSRNLFRSIIAHDGDNGSSIHSILVQAYQNSLVKLEAELFPQPIRQA